MIESITDVVLGSVSGKRRRFPVVMMMMVMMMMIVVVVGAGSGVTKVIEMALETPRGARLFDERFGFRRRNQALDPRVTLVPTRRRRRDGAEPVGAGGRIVISGAVSADRRRRHVGRRRHGVGEVGGVDRHALRHQIRTGSADGPRVDLLHDERRRGGRGHAVARVFQEAAAVVVVVAATVLVERVITAVDVGHGLRGKMGNVKIILEPFTTFRLYLAGSFVLCLSRIRKETGERWIVWL